jgi:uncharacterized lipoprotein NlpE involved in copper resistance
MRPSSIARLAVCAAILCAVGCNSNNKGKIEGTKWTSQTTTVKGNTVPAGALKLEFTRDGKMTYTNVGTPHTGTYSLSWGDYVTLNLDQALAGNRKHREKIVIRGDTLTMVDSDGTSVAFDREK